MGNKKVHIIGGGTVYHIRPHIALAAPAYGNTARQLAYMCKDHSDKLDVELHLTKMAGGANIETDTNLYVLVKDLISRTSTKIIFMSAAVVGYEATLEDLFQGERVWGDKYGEKLDPATTTKMAIVADKFKIINEIRKDRKDIFLVGFKTTSNLPENEQYLAGLKLLKEASCNLVLANDVKTRRNMIITPEEARYSVTTDRTKALKDLVEMTYLRSHLTFTRSTVVAGESIPWDSELVPNSLRNVVDHCIRFGAYKPFRGATVGHFAAKVGDNKFITSKRKTNFNELNITGLVLIETDGPDTVLAYGSKPSVGGQSQRIIFDMYPEYDCIVHFHCEKRGGSAVPSVSQREYECGSHECGQNTANGLKRFGNLSAVFLENHGPNIVFNSNINPTEVVEFINSNFDLKTKTGGPVYGNS